MTFIQTVCVAIDSRLVNNQDKEEKKEDKNNNVQWRIHFLHSADVPIPKPNFNHYMHYIKVEQEIVALKIRQTQTRFLVACYATLHPAMSVRRSVGRSVGRSPFYFFGVFELFEQTAPTQIP